MSDITVTRINVVNCLIPVHDLFNQAVNGLSSAHAAAAAVTAAEAPVTTARKKLIDPAWVEPQKLLGKVAAAALAVAIATAASAVKGAEVVLPCPAYRLRETTVVAAAAVVLEAAKTLKLAV